mgnify:CR=1 FL=1
MCSREKRHTRHMPHNEKQSFAVSQFKEFRYESTKPGIVTALPYINSFISHTFNLAKKKLSDFPAGLERAYKGGKVSINKKKIEDVRNLVKYIQGEDAHLFYQDILKWPTTSDD